MPIVKKQNADYRSDVLVSVAELAAKKSMESGNTAEPCGDDDVEVVRAVNGDVTQINVRCACGNITKVVCDY